MDQQEPTELILDVFTDPRSVRDVVKGKQDPPSPFPVIQKPRDVISRILHTIFFHRFFPAVTPQTREVLDLSLPYVDNDELETMIDQRAAALERQLDAERSSAGTGGAGGGGSRGQFTVQFFEKRRRKAWLTRGDDEVCWECWTLKVTVAEPKTESERAKVRRAMEQTLQTTVMKIVTFVNTHKDHIPPITTQGVNPFPYKITVDQKESSWANRMRMY
ncbi:unnamed protein product [Clonostachys byssicola]|uniref:Autophagy-related protein 101 n=1 Tax=Clonostachys byssicola TaxID=160290 RepID=A0A9N9XT27_9HYPO|nr:unnamed protein product [Clonostachys byssicola]